MKSQNNPPLVVIDQNSLPFDLEQVPENLRAMMVAAFYAAGAGAQAAEKAAADSPQLKEFYGRSPTDFRRPVSELPRPQQGGGSRHTLRSSLNGKRGAGGRS